ncbi:hypothetical protein EC988_008544, partial [Linderina pennispora]
MPTVSAAGSVPGPTTMPVSSPPSAATASVPAPAPAPAPVSTVSAPQPQLTAAQQQQRLIYAKQLRSKGIYNEQVIQLFADLMVQFHDPSRTPEEKAEIKHRLEVLLKNTTQQQQLQQLQQAQQAQAQAQQQLQ